MNAEQATTSLILALESSKTPYMLVGAVAAGRYGIVRSTKDADFLVELGGGSIDDILRKLPPEIRRDPQVNFETVTGKLRHILKIDGTVFLLEIFEMTDDPHDRSRMSRRVRGRINNVETWVPTVEDMLVTKLRWFKQIRRTKDGDDAQNIIAVNQSSLDWNYIHHWCDVHGTRKLLDDIRRSLPPL